MLRRFLSRFFYDKDTEVGRSLCEAVYNCPYDSGKMDEILMGEGNFSSIKEARKHLSSAIDTYEYGQKVSREDAFLLLKYYTIYKPEVIQQREARRRYMRYLRGYSFEKMLKVGVFSVSCFLLPLIVLIAYQQIIEWASFPSSKLVSLLLGGMGGALVMQLFNIASLGLDKIIPRYSLAKDIQTLKGACGVIFTPVKEIDQQPPKYESRTVEEMVPAAEKTDDFLEEIATYLQSLKSINTSLYRDELPLLERIIKTYLLAKDVIEKPESSATTELFQAYTVADACFAAFHELRTKIDSWIEKDEKNAVDRETLREIVETLRALRGEKPSSSEAMSTQSATKEGFTLTPKTNDSFAIQEI